MRQVVFTLLLITMCAFSKSENYLDVLRQGGFSIPLAAESSAEMMVYLPSETSDTPRRAVLICPGGAYATLAIDREGVMWSNYFNSVNIAAIVVAYRMPHGNPSIPVSDVLEAMRQAKEHATEWNINPNDIGIMGFSAGGHLASTVSLHAPDDLKPAFQILFYPVITMNESFTHLQSRQNLLGNNPSDNVVKQYSGELNVTCSTPRAFIATGSKDDAVPALNSARYYEALVANGVEVEIHTYPTSVHGFAMKNIMPWEPNLLIELRDWLRSF